MGAATIVDMTQRVIDSLADLAEQLRGQAEEAEKVDADQDGIPDVYQQDDPAR